MFLTRIGRCLMDRRWCTRKYLTLGIGLEVPSYKKTLAATLLDLSPSDG
jgi:hypothetical protein